MGTFLLKKNHRKLKGKYMSIMKDNTLRFIK